jgi:hypothetical protein
MQISAKANMTRSDETGTLSPRRQLTYVDGPCAILPELMKRCSTCGHVLLIRAIDSTNHPPRAPAAVRALRFVGVAATRAVAAAYAQLLARAQLVARVAATAHRVRRADHCHRQRLAAQQLAAEARRVAPVRERARDLVGPEVVRRGHKRREHEACWRHCLPRPGSARTAH